MRRILLIITMICFIINCAGENQMKVKKEDSKSVMQEQLLDIKSISLIVYVDYDLADNLLLKKEIYCLAQQKLKDSGLDLGGGWNTYLSIDVFSYHVEIKGLEKYLLLQVRTELLDEAQLIRNPNLRNPHGYVIWSKECVFVSSMEEYKSRIEKEVIKQVDDFCRDRNMAEKYKLLKKR